MKKVQRARREELGIACSRFEINSSNALIVGGCKRVLVYQNDIVRLSLCDMTVEICGSGLCIRSFFGEEVEVCGNISSIRFDKGGMKNS